MTGHGSRRGVVERERGGQWVAGTGGDPVAQFDRGDRGEAQLLESAVGPGDVADRHVPHGVEYQIEQDPPLLGLRQVPEPGAQRRGLGRVRLDGGDGRVDQATEQRRYGTGLQGRGVRPHGGEVRLAGRVSGAEQGEGLVHR